MIIYCYHGNLGDNAADLATDLVACGLLSAEDCAKITELIVSKLTY